MAIAPDGTLAGHRQLRRDGADLGRDGTLRAPLTGHTGSVEAVAISPDGTWLVTGAGTLDGRARIWAANGTPRSTLTEHKFDVDAVATLPRTTRPWPVIAEHAPGRLPGSGHRWGWRVTVAGRSQEVTRARGDRRAGPARPGIMGARFRSSFHPDHARRRRRAQAAPGAELTGRAAPGAAPAIRAPSRFLLGSLTLLTCPPMPCQAVLEPGAPGRTRAGWPTLSVLIPAPRIPRCGGMTGWRNVPRAAHLRAKQGSER